MKAEIFLVFTAVSFSTSIDSFYLACSVVQWVSRSVVSDSL